MSTAPKPQKQAWLDYLLLTIDTEETITGGLMEDIGNDVACVNLNYGANAIGWEQAEAELNELARRAYRLAKHKYRNQQLFAAVIKYIKNPDLRVEVHY